MNFSLLLKILKHEITSLVSHDRKEQEALIMFYMSGIVHVIGLLSFTY